MRVQVACEAQIGGQRRETSRTPVTLLGQGVLVAGLATGHARACGIATLALVAQGPLHRVGGSALEMLITGNWIPAGSARAEVASRRIQPRVV